MKRLAGGSIFILFVVIIYIINMGVISNRVPKDAVSFSGKISEIHKHFMVIGDKKVIFSPETEMPATSSDGKLVDFEVTLGWDARYIGIMVDVVGSKIDEHTVTILGNRNYYIKAPSMTDVEVEN